MVTLITKNFEGHLDATAELEPGGVYTETDIETTVRQVQAHVEACQYNQALQRIWSQVIKPADQYLDRNAPWKLVKTDKEGAKRVLYDAAEQLRVVSILLKPFLPRAAEDIYRCFNFPQPWEAVRYEDAWVHPRQGEDLRVFAELEGDKVNALFPRIIK